MRTGWCSTTIDCCNWNGKAGTGRRPRVGVLVRENEAGEVVIHYRNQRVGFRELKASIALGEEKGRPWSAPQN